MLRPHRLFGLAELIDCRNRQPLRRERRQLAGIQRTSVVKRHICHPFHRFTAPNCVERYRQDAARLPQRAVPPARSKHWARILQVSDGGMPHGQPSVDTQSLIDGQNDRPGHGHAPPQLHAVKTFICSRQRSRERVSLQFSHRPTSRFNLAIARRSRVAPQFCH